FAAPFGRVTASGTRPRTEAPAARRFAWVGIYSIQEDGGVQIRPLSTCLGSEGKMVRSWLISVTTCLLSIPLVAQEPVRPAVTGRWDLTIVTNAGRRAPSWLQVHWSGNRVLVGQFVGVVGSVRPISRLDFANDTLRFSVRPQWEEGNGAFQFTGAFASDSLAGSVITPDGHQLAWSAHR